jgi:hypothetical protein
LERFESGSLAIPILEEGKSVDPWAYRDETGQIGRREKLLMGPTG